jgi:hypothetical protein
VCDVISYSRNNISIADVGQMENSTVWDKGVDEHHLQTAWSFWYDRKQTKKVGGARYLYLFNIMLLFIVLLRSVNIALV